MQRRLVRVAVTTAIACVVLAPALIWSGQRPQPERSVAGGDFDFSKEPPVFTVGPPMTEQALAEREMEKRLSLPEAEARGREFIAGGSRHAQVREGPASPGGAGSPGLTPAEVQKLDAVRRGALAPRGDRGTWPRKSTRKSETIDVPLRPPGAEGLTPAERAKLGATRAPQDNGRDEGGRPR